MAWLAVNKDKTESVFSTRPYKIFGDINAWGALEGNGVGVKLPKGSIAKLIGKELTWKNEPVEIK